MTDDPQDARLGGKRPRKKHDFSNTGPLPGEKRRKPTNLQPRDRMLRTGFNILIFAFIGYAFYNYLQQGGDGGVLNKLVPQLEKAEQYAASYSEDVKMDRLLSQQQMNITARLFPQQRPTVRTRTIQQGTGSAALCGQQIRYRFISDDGEARKETSSFRLGGLSAPRGLTLGLLGIKEGELRELAIPHSLWQSAEYLDAQQADAIRFRVKLESILSPSLPDTPMPIRRFTRRHGEHLGLRCGDQALMHLRFWDGKGHILFNSAESGKPVYLLLGDASLPYGLTQALQDMAMGGEYTVILPPEMLAPLDENAQTEAVPSNLDAQPFPQQLHWPKDELVIIDISYPEKLQKPLPKAPSSANSPLETFISPLMQQPNPELNTTEE